MKRRNEAACYIVTKSEHGEDRVWAGVKDGKHTWTLIPENMRRLSAALALELLRDHADANDPRVIAADSVLGPTVRLGKDHKTYILGN